MSHEIGTRDKLVGTYKFWHGLNDVVALIDNTTNPLRKWDVKAEPVMVQVGVEKRKQGAVTREVPKMVKTGYSILTATDDNLPVGVPFTGSYRPLLNSEFVKLVEDSLASVPGLKYEIQSAGSIKDKNRVFMSVYLPGASELKVGGREFLCYLNFLNSFDMSCRLTVLDSNICTVCNNTFSANLADDSGALKIAVKHTRNMPDTLKDIPRLINAAITGRQKFAAQLNAFHEFPVNVEQAERIFAAWLGTDGESLSTRTANIVERLKELFVRGKGNDGKTALDLFSSVTDYYTHESAGESDDKFKQFESSEFGNAAEKKQEFFNLLCDTLQTTEKFNGVCRIGDKILVAYGTKVKATKAQKEAAKAEEKRLIKEAREKAKAAEAQKQAAQNKENNSPTVTTETPVETTVQTAS